jgi:radical SAM protein with 4Fe4S-binding SPASM domain
MTPTRPLALPYILQIEITSHCNLKCKMCPLTLEGVPSSLRPGHMQEVTWEQVRRLAKEIGRVNLTGYGEPLANPRFLPLLRELDDLDIKMGFSTNGALITPRTVEALAALRYPIHVNISIDSPDPVLYHQIRGGDLDRALAGLRLLAAGLPPPKWVSVSSVVLDSNLDSLAAFPPLLAQMGVKKYLLQGVIDWNPDLRGEDLVHRGRLPEQLRRIEAACREHNITLELQPGPRLEIELRDPEAALRLYHGRTELSTEQTRQCCVPWDLPFINKDGQVFPCCYSDASALMGDLREQSFAEIWHGERFRQFRADLIDGRSAPAVCRRCTAVPVGPHPLKLYAARILTDESILRARRRFKLVVENAGTATWTRETGLHIGTSEVRDRGSAYFHPSWISGTRVAGFEEESVPPGGKATFRFRITPDDDVPVEVFQLVVEGLCWLPDTLFELYPRPNLFRAAHLRLKAFAARRLAHKSAPSRPSAIATR